MASLRFIAAASAVLAVVFATLALKPPPEGVPVAVARADLQAGATITRGGVRVILVPKEAVPHGASAEVTAFVGDIPSRFVEAGTVLTGHILGVAEESAPLPLGYAQTVLTLEEESPFIETGNTVEVWGLPSACEDDSCSVRKLAEDVQVVEVARADSSMLSDSSPTLVSLNLPAESVGPVLHAAEVGRIHFVRRE